MNCFGNNRPKITSSDRTRNLEAKTIYQSNVRSYQQGGGDQCKNFNGHVGFYRNGLLRNVRSYDQKRLMQRGYSLCVDGAYSQKCRENPNLEKDNGIGQHLQRGIYSCPKSNYLSYQPVKITMGPDSIYNQFVGSSLNAATSCNPLSGFRVMESWDGTFNANQQSTPPWNNFFGYPPKEDHYGEGSNSRSIKDPSGNDVPLSTNVIDPDNNLFGTDFCVDQLSLGEGPMKYLAFTRASHFDIIQGQLFDPTGEKYNDTATGVVAGSRLMDCDFLETRDICGNVIRVPKVGDLAIAGLGSLLDMNSNIAQSQNITAEWLQTAWVHLPGPWGLNLYEELRKAIDADAPKKSYQEQEYDIHDYVQVIRKFLVSMSWAFQWFTGIGVIDRICCIDEKRKIWRIIVKSFWGDMHPPEGLPADLEAVYNPGRYGDNNALALDTITWRGGAGAIDGKLSKVGGVHATGSHSDISAMVNNVATFPPGAYTHLFNAFGDVDSAERATGVTPNDWPTPPGEASVSVTGLTLQELATLGQDINAYEVLGVGGSLPSNCAMLAGAANGSDQSPSACVTCLATPPAPLCISNPEIYAIPIEWEVLHAKEKTLNIVRWGVFPTLFAGWTPAGKKFEQSLYGGGIGFISQSEIASYFKKLLGTGVPPIAIMGYKNTGHLRWGSAEDTGNASGAGQCMARNAMLLDTTEAGGALRTRYNLEKWNIGANSAQASTPFGHWVLQDLTKEPYAVQKAAGECGVRNLAYGNNTRQNYLVSYSEQAGKINFAVNQKLYTAAEGGTLADLDLLDALDYTILDNTTTLYMVGSLLTYGPLVNPGALFESGFIAYENNVCCRPNLGGGSGEPPVAPLPLVHSATGLPEILRPQQYGNQDLHGYPNGITWNLLADLMWPVCYLNVNMPVAPSCCDPPPASCCVAGHNINVPPAINPFPNLAPNPPNVQTPTPPPNNKIQKFAPVSNITTGGYITAITFQQKKNGMSGTVWLNVLDALYTGTIKMRIACVSECDTVPWNPAGWNRVYTLKYSGVHQIPTARPKMTSGGTPEDVGILSIHVWTIDPTQNLPGQDDAGPKLIADLPNTEMTSSWTWRITLERAE